MNKNMFDQVKAVIGEVEPLLKSWAMTGERKKMVLMTLELKLKETYNEGYKEGWKDSKRLVDPSDLRPDPAIKPSILNRYKGGY